MIQCILFFTFQSSSNTSLSVSVYLKRMRNSPKSIHPNKIWNKNDKIEHLTYNVCMCAMCTIHGSKMSIRFPATIAFALK